MDLILESKTVSNTIQMRHRDADDQLNTMKLDKKNYTVHISDALLSAVHLLNINNSSVEEHHLLCLIAEIPRRSC